MTSDWQYAEELARRFPSASVIAGRTVLRNGHVTSCSSDSSAPDLALALINEDTGRESARRAAGLVSTPLRRPEGQPPFADVLGRESRHPGLRRAQQQVAESPRSDLSTSALARHAGLSERQFTRLFRAEVGLTVQQYVQRVRIHLASELLISTTLDIADIARVVGFGGETNLTSAFSQVLQASPADYRTRSR